METPAPTFNLHHTGYLVGDLPAAGAHFCGLLGYRVESAVIEDSAQTARVQFLRQPGADSWLELVSPASENSKLSSALKKGGGLHHLCYEVDELGAACAHLRAGGMFPLGEPVPAVAFPGRRIAWFMDARRLLVELVEAGKGVLSLASLRAGQV
ncbi:VOC family protein [Ruficoccus amylovorans]|uniref:VOC family protein n=1 Tax=Ruficoccus amylovorans TaxID=1804625 RepID=A0A842HFB5_9BACT|nr:VOC family protein [Ruficoccus amylovorans]MBC2594326.1 VOC family protein [Ruficoccus amylovorans]